MRRLSRRNSLFKHTTLGGVLSSALIATTILGSATGNVVHQAKKKWQKGQRKENPTKKFVLKKEFPVKPGGNSFDRGGSRIDRSHFSEREPSFGRSGSIN